MWWNYCKQTPDSSNHPAVSAYACTALLSTMIKFSEQNLLVIIPGIS